MVLRTQVIYNQMSNKKNSKSSESEAEEQNFEEQVERNQQAYVEAIIQGNWELEQEDGLMLEQEVKSQLEHQQCPDHQSKPIKPCNSLSIESGVKLSDVWRSLCYFSCELKIVHGQQDFIQEAFRVEQSFPLNDRQSGLLLCESEPPSDPYQFEMESMDYSEASSKQESEQRFGVPSNCRDSGLSSDDDTEGGSGGCASLTQWSKTEKIFDCLSFETFRKVEGTNGVVIEVIEVEEADKKKQ